MRVAGERYVTVAQTISSAASRLRDIARVDGTVSRAVDAIREKATEVAADIVRAHDRYAGVGDALVTYADRLATAQAASVSALLAAQRAQSAIDAAESDVRRATTALDDAAPEDQVASRSAVNRARSAVTSADVALSRARNDLQDATDLRDRAARQAIDAIDQVTGSDGLDDSWWDDWGSKIVHAVSNIAGIVASVAGILSLVLCWVPVLGEALAAVALIATAVKLVTDIMLALGGEGSWGDVAWGVVALASFGVGRVLGVAARSATRGAQGTARLAAGRAAAQSPALRAAAGLPTSSSTSTIRALVGESAALSRNAARGMAGQGSAASWGSRALEALKPSSLGGDVAGGWRYATDPLVRSAARAEIGATFQAAGTDGRALFAASQADGDLVRAIVATSEISPALTASSPATAQAVHSALAWQAGSVGAVAYGAYDTTFGVQQTSAASGGVPYVAPVVDSVQWVVDLWGPSPADQLQLAH